jgi:hypothetical protein
MNMTPSQLANSTLHFSSEPKPDPLAEIKAAHAAGKRIQARQYPPGSHAWHCVKNPSWDSTHFEWRVAPWSLPAPPDGQQWHRTDWTEDMLEGGWRPLLLGEKEKLEDFELKNGVFFTENLHGDYRRAEKGWVHHRTRRPIPTPPRMVPKLYLVSEDGGETWKKTEVAK